MSNDKESVKIYSKRNKIKGIFYKFYKNEFKGYLVVFLTGNIAVEFIEFFQYSKLTFSKYLLDKVRITRLDIKLLYPIWLNAAKNGITKYSIELVQGEVDENYSLFIHVRGTPLVLMH